MILQKLTLLNFGQYRGHHDLDMSGVSIQKPILLIGGQNGGGKTTILDAMQLCLYGKRSNCFMRSGQRWDNYLQSCINRDSDIKEETRVKVVFLHPYEGREAEFQVEFSWRIKGKKIISKKDIYRNGILDDSISESWDIFIDSILPARLSTLFFFDGEQIENLVRTETAKDFLESAITELLGIGTLDKLHVDLTTLNRNKSLSDNLNTAAKKIKEVEDSFSEIKKQLCRLDEHLAMLRQERIKLVTKGKTLEQEYETKGGKLLDEQSLNEKLKHEIEHQLGVVNRQIIKYQSGILPLHLLKGQLRQIQEHATKEQHVTNNLQQKELISSLHRKFIAEAKNSGATDQVLAALTKLSDNEKMQVDSFINKDLIYINLSTDGIEQLGSILKSLPEAEDSYNNLKEQKHKLQRQVDKLEAKLDATPEKGDLLFLFKERRAISKKLSSIEIDIASKEDVREQLNTRVQKLEAQVVMLLGESAAARAQHEDDQRVILYSLRAQKYIKEFKTILLDKHLEKLQYFILESFQHLIKKTTLVKKLSIDPDNFAITLTNAENKIVPAEKLSAGERQLLAVAIFWGLQKATCRPIPVMIDSPMGRLDSIHRDHLVRRYLPLSAHQVILLSTDEEISGEYYNIISKNTYKELTIEFVEHNLTSCIKEGYFREH